MHSGISTMARELVLGIVHKYKIVQIAGAVKHPEAGKIIDLSGATKQQTGVQDASVVLYPTDGYGNEQLVFAVMEREKPDALVFFTDPRYWGWLFAIEHQIRQKIPMVYYNIWDSVPFPQWNKPFYESCDGLFSISKQTYNINKHVLQPENCITIDGSFDATGNLIK